MRDAGELPAPLKIGRLVRWRKEAVDHWFGKVCDNDPDQLEAVAKKFRDRRTRKTHPANDHATDYKGNKGS